MNLKIRNYVPADYVDVKAILQEANMFDDAWDSENNYRSLVEESPSAILVAVDGHKIVGNIIIDSFGKEQAFLFRFAIKTDYRSQGVGTILLEAAERVVKDRGGRETCLFVDAEQQQLQKFYTKRGYQSSDKKFVTMWKPLTR